MIDSKLLMSAAALLAVVSLSAEAKLYKWVDNNGVTHYGETIPPEFSTKDAVRLEKGRIEKREEKRDGKLITKSEVETKDPVADKARIEAKRRDNALVNTYSSEQEIDLARNRNLQQVEARTGSYTTMLTSAKESLTSLQQEADKRTKQGLKVFKSLEEDIVEANARIVKLQGDLENSLKETEAVKARYEADKVRYRELKGYAPKKN